jgi:hypothetical protein
MTMTMQSVVPTAGIAGEAVRDAAPPPLPQPLRSLLAALDRKGVRHCHWKSNIRLARALTGEEDVCSTPWRSTRRRAGSCTCTAMSRSSAATAW